MNRYTLHVPVFLNDGSTVPEDILSDVEDELSNIAGGWTMIPSAVGGWRGDDRSYRELVNLYLIDTAEDLVPGRLLEDLARRIAVALEQEAVYLTKQHIDTVLVTPAREETTA